MDATTTYSATYFDQLRLMADPESPQPEFGNSADLANHLRLTASHIAAALKMYRPDDEEDRQHLAALLVMIGNEARAGAEYLNLMPPIAED